MTSKNKTILTLCLFTGVFGILLVIATFLDLEIDVHEDFQIQKKIGELLSAYDNLIENNQKQINKTNLIDE